MCGFLGLCFNLNMALLTNSSCFGCRVASYIDGSRVINSLCVELSLLYMSNCLGCLVRLSVSADGCSRGDDRPRI